MIRKMPFAARYGMAFGILCLSGIALGQEITRQNLLDGLKNPARWLTYSGDYSGQRHSPLKQITPANAGQLTAQWTFQNGIALAGQKFETSPLVIDRKSTRLNSSHLVTSYAVFCLKKK